MGMSIVRGVTCAALALALAGCGWPKDPEHTAEHVEGKVLRAGVSENPPYVVFQGSQVMGLEADLIRAIAADLHAQVQWSRGAEGPLMTALKDHKLDIVAAGVTEENLWAKELGAPRSYGKAGGHKHMLLVPPGENAWILRLDRILATRAPAFEARLKAAAP
jgi:polar amino acid transport system substrate-binding protein